MARRARRARAASTIDYRLRDWGFSRQRYWGCPIPIVYCERCGIVPVPDDQLPVVLPEVEDFQPKGRPPLAQAEDWVNVDCPSCGGPAQPRDRDDGHVRRLVLVLPPLLRPDERRGAVRPRELVDYWHPVDQYIGGVDHATMHLLYARFWVKVLNDMGLVGFREPFASFFSNGWVTHGTDEDVEASGNSVGPIEFVERYGADAVRLFILFLGPADQDMEWTRGRRSRAMARFVRRLWRVVQRASRRSRPPGRPRAARWRGRRTRRSRRSTDDIDRRFAFNTAISAVMELVNELVARHRTSRTRGSPPRRPSR